MSAARELVVNADDFGCTAGVNAGIVEAHVRGIVTSTSLMVRGAAVEDAVRLSAEHPRLGVGLHVDLGEWVFAGDEWHRRDFVVDTDDAEAVRAEVERQLEAFLRAAGRPPTHLDSHQHAHVSSPAVTPVVDALGARLGVPVRRRSGHAAYCGAFYGQTGRGDPYPRAISPAALVGVIAGLPPGCTELCCHPGYADGLDSAYAAERELEVAALCDPSVRAAIVREGVVLRSFADLVRGATPA